VDQVPAEDWAYGQHPPDDVGSFIRAAVVHQEQREVAVMLRSQGF
jgi:hypothetical protein